MGLVYTMILVLYSNIEKYGRPGYEAVGVTMADSWDHHIVTLFGPGQPCTSV